MQDVKLDQRPGSGRGDVQLLVQVCAGLVGVVC